MTIVTVIGAIAILAVAIQVNRRCYALECRVRHMERFCEFDAIKAFDDKEQAYCRYHRVWHGKPKLISPNPHGEYIFRA